MPYDVIIIGGGIAGCAVARELSRYRLKLALIEKEIEAGFGTSKANSGIIHGGHHASTSTLKGRLEWEGNQMWDDLCADLGFGFDRVGELTVALAEEQVPVLHELLDNAAARNVPGLQLWDRERIRRESMEGEWRQAEGMVGELVTLHARYAARDVLAGRSVQAGALAGVACGLSADGSLQVRDALGALHALHSGEVSVRPC